MARRDMRSRHHRTIVGILPPGAKVPALVGNPVIYRDGVGAAALVAGEIHWFETLPRETARTAEELLVRRRAGSPLLSSQR
jgi:hypothetical protein